MSQKAIKILKKIRSSLGLSTPKLSEKLGFKSASHVWLVENGYRNPSIKMCQRLIKLAKENDLMELTIDMLRGENE